MSATTNMTIKLNNNTDANKAAAIMKEVASKVTPDYPTEISKFVADITVEDCTVKVEESYSLMSCTFCDMIPQIMRAIAKNGFGPITMEAWFTSFSSDYEAEFSGRVYKNGKFTMTFSEHDN